MATKRTTTNPEATKERAKFTERELDLIRRLRRVIRNKTSTHALQSFMFDLNDMVTTALIAECLDRIEKQEAAQAL